MNRLTALVVALFIALLYSGACAAQNGGGTPSASLNDTETADLVFMREEEKLSRDTYDTLSSLWGLNVFSNISSSEQRHMDTMLSKLEFFGIEDPVVSDAAGSFSNAELAALYPQLIARGEDSLLEALKVGAFIEELDIEDLLQAIENTDKTTLINAYSNLLAASRNHLRTFVSHITNLGVDYEAQVLDQSDVDDVVGDYDVLPGENFSINAGLNDAWYFPETNGQGFLITVFPEQRTLFLAWFTYDTEFPAECAVARLGGPAQRWITAQGRYNGGQADLEITMSLGGSFDTGLPVPERKAAGSILLQFDDCTSGSVTYDIPSIDRSGVVPIMRIVTDNVALCQELNALGQ